MSMYKAKRVPTPMINSCQLSKLMSEPLFDPHEYHSIVWALKYVVLTSPDIAYVINIICQFMHALTNVHFVVVKRVLRYLYDTINYGLQIQSSERPSLVGYVGAN